MFIFTCSLPEQKLNFSYDHQEYLGCLSLKFGPNNNQLIAIRKKGKLDEPNIHEYVRQSVRVRVVEEADEGQKNEFNLIMLTSY